MQEPCERGEFVPAVHVANHVDFSFCLGDFLLAGDLGAAAHAEEGHLEFAYMCGIAYLGCVREAVIVERCGRNCRRGFANGGDDVARALELLEALGAGGDVLVTLCC